MRGAQFEMSMKIVVFSTTAVFIPGIIAQSLFLFAQIAAWYQHRFIDLRARSVSIRNPLPSMSLPRFLPIVALGWAQEKEKDWDVLHITSVSSMLLGRTGIFLVWLLLLILFWLSVRWNLAIGYVATPCAPLFLCRSVGLLPGSPWTPTWQC